MDKAAARAELWRRYDAGDVAADEVEARLRLLDRIADGDEAAVRAALDAPVPMHRRRSTKRVAVAALGVLAAVGIVGGILTIADAVGDSGDGDGDEDRSAQILEPVFGGDVNVGRVIVDPVPMPLPAPAIIPAACPEADRIREESPETEAPGSSALLSDPAFVPEGYEVADDYEVTPGQDPDLGMSSAAGFPPPVEIAGRDLSGELVVRMRTFLHGNADEAIEAAAASTQTGCSFAAEFFEMPDRPEIRGAVVRGAGIPTTVFAGWRLEDRRFLVAVEPAGDDDEAVARARDLAQAIADAERTAAIG